MFANNPALVLNADFQPLSYFPLSLFGWEDSVRAVVMGSHAVVAEYDQVVRSPSTTMRLPSVIALREYVRPPTRGKHPLRTAGSPGCARSANHPCERQARPINGLDRSDDFFQLS
jgi:hypothetical protein